MKIKKGDKVVVIAGKEKGKTGTIVHVYPARNMVILDKMNKRQTTAGRKGQIVEIAMPIHASNVMLADPKDGKPTRIKIDRKDGGRVRLAVKSGQTI